MSQPTQWELDMREEFGLNLRAKSSGVTLGETTPREKAINCPQAVVDGELEIEARTSFKKKQYSQLFGLKAKLGILPSDLQALQNQIDELTNRVKSQNRKDLVFITINPKPEVSLEKFLTIVHHTANRKMFLHGSYCLEQRGTTLEDIGKGMHAHFAMERDKSYKPSKIAKNISNSLLKQDIIGHAKHVDVRQYPMKFLQDKIEYMSGNKWDKGKEEAVKINKTWRVQNDLKNIYVKSI